MFDSQQVKCMYVCMYVKNNFLQGVFMRVGPKHTFMCYLTCSITVPEVELKICCKKSRIRETPNLSTDVDRSTDTERSIMEYIYGQVFLSLTEKLH